MTIFRKALIGSTALLAATSASAQPSTNATANLIRLLIEQKVITAKAGEALLAQAEAEAAQARAALTPPTATAELAPAPAGTIRVPYIPESLRAKITADIKQEVLAQAEFEGWSRPNQVPAWVKGVRLYGDFRLRSESAFYSDNNANELIDFQAFNDISPIDINPNTNPTGFPLLNTRTDRANRLRLRARFGVEAKLSDFAQVNFQLATGDDNSPISTNQILGGGLAKKDVWVDEAYLKLSPYPGVTAWFGRFEAPFRSTNLLYDVDVNFDGGAVTLDAARYVPEGVRVAVTGGAFPLGFSGNNFPTTDLDKQGDKSKWLFVGQVRGGYTYDDNLFDVDLSAAYHSFKSVQGELSTSCALFNGNRQCSTDQFRPTFLRKGNTLFFLRDIARDPASPNNFAQPQVLGLAFDYDVLDLLATVKVPLTDTIAVSLTGNYLRNLSFKRSDLCRNNPNGLPLNNITEVAPVAGALPGTPGAAFYTNPCVADANGRIASFDGGNQGYSIRAVVGTARPRKFGEWNVEASYRYLESDATLDSLTDSDFHLGGTNAKGYVVGGTFGLFNNVALTGRWLSANQISGPPLAIDVLQIDLTASF